ncbi:MAG: amino acid ABC transporter [Proteobacteria bacterium]|nr:MAG: amino acid ABC transporter [Pseudomonadota bacterium]QKK10600.1 MAG: ABC transporter substrate-binding protein [Pseudomonadota bacterium]
MKQLKLILISLALIAGGSGAALADSVRIATEGAYPPFNMKSASGELEGFDVDIAKALCAKMNAKCDIVAQDWDGIIPGLLAKKYDAIIASMSITDERKQKVAFTSPYYSNYLRFVAAKGSGLQATAEGLKGKNLGAQRATIAAQHLEDNFRKSASVKVYDTQEAAYLDLKAGRIDALLSDIYPAYDWMQQADNSGFEFIGDSIDINDKIGIAVRKGDKSLAEKFDKALKEIRADGTYQKINAKYFPFDIF